jgi:hypothetical protein
LDHINAKIDIIAAEIKESSYKAYIPPSQTATEAARGATQAPIGATQAATSAKQPQEASKKPLSYAQALKRPQAQQAAPKVTTYRERRLILQGTAKEYPVVDSRGLRDQINKAFTEKCQIVTPVIGTVTKSLKGGDIVLSTTEKFDAEFLKKNEAI